MQTISRIVDAAQLSMKRTAVPVPMATPMSAFRSAGASLTPSPVMATTCPWVHTARDL